MYTIYDKPTTSPYHRWERNYVLGKDNENKNDRDNQKQEEYAKGREWTRPLKNSWSGGKGTQRRGRKWVKHRRERAKQRRSVAIRMKDQDLMIKVNHRKNGTDLFSEDSKI